MINASGFTFFSPTRIEFGVGKIEILGAEAVKLGMRRICIISDPGINKLGLVDDVATLLAAKSIDCTVFDDVATDPDIGCVERGVKTFLDFGADGLVAIGGGSPMDVAKAMGVVVNGGFPVEEYGMDRRVVNSPIPPLITVPTTAGTGSEVTRGAIITNGKERIKMAVRAPVKEAELTSARVCILDPGLTFSLPRAMTVATGLDALSHGVEQLVSNSSHAVSKAVSKEVIRLVFRYLGRAAADGHDVEARSGMLQASALAGIGMAAGLGAAHALAHSLGANCHLHHGLAVGAVLPGVMAANLRECEEEYAHAYKCTRVSVAEDSVRKQATALVRSVIDLLVDLGVLALGEMDLRIDIDQVITGAQRETFLLGTNPVRLSREEMATILSVPYKEIPMGRIP